MKILNYYHIIVNSFNHIKYMPSHIFTHIIPRAKKIPQNVISNAKNPKFLSYHILFRSVKINIDKFMNASFITDMNFRNNRERNKFLVEKQEMMYNIFSVFVKALITLNTDLDDVNANMTYFIHMIGFTLWYGFNFTFPASLITHTFQHSNCSSFVQNTAYHCSYVISHSNTLTPKCSRIVKYFVRKFLHIFVTETPV